jgi:hypothetical protein
MSEVKNEVEADIPFGAIENGRAFMDRVEHHYDFTCEAGPLRSCYEWQEARLCFEQVALWATYAALSQPVPERPAAEEVEAIRAEIKQFRRDAGNLATALSLGGSIEKVTEVLRIIESGGPTQ